jgi:hypothetical protein
MGAMRDGDHIANFLNVAVKSGLRDAQEKFVQE